MIDRKKGLDVFKALSDGTRLRLVRILAFNQTAMCVCEFVDVLQEKQYNVSKHLKILDNSGILSRDKQGKWIYYGLSDYEDEASQKIFSAIASMPDPDGIFQLDQERFEERKRLRQDGRCQVGIQTPSLALG